ncbi:ABC-F family ATP-binding cassette domain-containing protein [Hydrogenophaga aquatica]
MITLRNVTLRRGTKVVLDQANATINPGEKAGLVGRNGAGKSSLFALLQGVLHEDSGEFAWPRQWRLSQVAQEMPETSQPCTEFVIDGDTRLSEARQEVAQAEASGDGIAIAHAHTELQDAGAHDAEARAQALLLGLGFQVNELQRPVNSFSGGWRMRLQLARALMCPSDLLMLDEPTNHLDLDALVWLESWLKRYQGTLLVISHDREFLDAVTQVTLHIDQGRLTRYGGNYSRFEDMRAEQITQQQAAYARQQDRIAHLQRFIDRFKAKATKAKQAQSRVKALERMEKIAPVLTEADFTFEFQEPAQLPNPMLSLRDAAFGYRAEDGAEAVIVRNVTRSVQAGQRLGILGANGQGKSTFVKTVARALPLLAGTVTEGKGLNIGYFAQQELDVLRPDDSPLAHMIRLARETEAAGTLTGQSTREQDLRNFLGSFQFSGDMVQQPVGTMSGGEKARLVLCMIVWQRPNLLLLDEPTNHLDLATREALAVALNEFEGTVMLVSHDRALLRSVCDEFWLVSHGGISPFDGDLDDYQRYLLDVARQKREAVAAAARPEASPASPAAEAPKLNPGEQRRLDAQRRQALAQKIKPHKQELEKLDRRLAEIQALRSELEQKLMTPLDPQVLADAGRQLKRLEEETEAAEERWLELSDLIEGIEKEALQA